MSEMNWKKVRDDLWTSHLSDKSPPSPMREALQVRFSPAIADAIERRMVTAAEYYETMVDDEEQEHYPMIATLAKRLRKEIEKAPRFKIYTRENSPRFMDDLKKTEERALRDSKRLPPKKRFKDRDRTSTMALTLACILEKHGVIVNRDENGDFDFAIGAVFQELGLPHADVRRKLIPKTIAEIERKKAFEVYCQSLRQENPFDRKKSNPSPMPAANGRAKCADSAVLLSQRDPENAI